MIILEYISKTIFAIIVTVLTLFVILVYSVQIHWILGVIMFFLFLYPTIVFWSDIYDI